MIVLFCFSLLTFFFFFKTGWTPLHTAASKGLEEIVKIFIGHGANVNIQNQVFFSSFLLGFLCFYLLIFFICGVLLKEKTFFFLNFFLFLLEWSHST